MFDITLYQFSPAWGLPNPSPFCMKLEGYLRLAGLNYEVRPQNDPRKGPKGKLPYARINGQLMGDSERIYDYLLTHQQLDLQAGLSPEQRAVHHAVRVMCDESLYFALLYSRWADAQNWPLVAQTFFGGMPALLRKPIAAQIRKRMLSVLELQGIGRHAGGEIYAIGSRHIDHLSALLGDQLWFSGHDQPVKLDVVVVSYLANLLLPPLASPMQQTLEQHANLVAFTHRALAHIYDIK